MKELEIKDWRSGLVVIIAVTHLKPPLSRFFLPDPKMIIPQ